MKTQKNNRSGLVKKYSLKARKLTEKEKKDIVWKVTHNPKIPLRIGWLCNLK